MPQSSKVKPLVKAAVAAVAKIPATAAEAKQASVAWHAVADDPETTNDLRSVALTHTRELEGAIVNGDATARESHLRALVSAAARYE